MRYQENGKRSKAWWLQAVKWFGADGTPGIMRGGEVATHHVKFAMDDLASSGMVERKGGGRGNKLTFNLTPQGSRYLEEHEDELESKPTSGHSLPPVDPSPAYTWKQPIAGPVRYFHNGEFVLQTEVPAEELERMTAEQEAARPKTGTPIVHHPVPAIPEFRGPPMPVERTSPPRGRPPKVADVTEYCGVPAGGDQNKYSHKHALTTTDKCPDKMCALLYCCGRTRPAGHPQDGGKNDMRVPAPAATPKANILRHTDHESETPASTLPDARKEQPTTTPPATPQRIIREQFKGAFREVLVEILLEKFARQVTAADVMERLESNNG